MDRNAIPWWTSQAGLLVSAYVLAAGTRLVLAGVAPYGDEMHHYYFARHFGQGPDNLYPIMDNRWLFWWRPLFSALLAPGAQFGFTAFRVGYILLAATLAPAVVAWLLARGVRRPAAALAGAVAALHPVFWVWGVRAFPDGLMAAAFVVGLALYDRGRLVAGAAMLLVAAWVKESALVGIAVLLAHEGLRSLQRTGRWQASFTLHGGHVALAAALALSYVPQLVARRMGAPRPGWTRGGELDGVLDGVFTSFWYLPLVVAALFVPASRRPALLALGYAAFYAVYTVVLGGYAEGWYYVLPAVLALLAIAAMLDSIARMPRRRLLAQATTAFALLVVALQVTLPVQSAFKQDVLHVASGTQEPSLVESLAWERDRRDHLTPLLSRLDEEASFVVLLVDTAWFEAIWPASDHATHLGTAYTEHRGPDPEWANVIEGIANTTIIVEQPFPLNRALRDVYADCLVDRDGPYLAYAGQACKGRDAALRARYDELRPGTTSTR